MAAGFAVALTLYLVLIPAYGATGAAIASTIAYITAGLVAAVLVVRKLRVATPSLLPRPADFLNVVRAVAVVRRHR
jgi:Na+-driven multidrug efflux pump